MGNEITMTDWRYTINLKDVFHNDQLTFEQSRDAVVKRLRSTAWFKGKDEFDDLPQAVIELSETTNENDFDEVWDAIYDEADADKIWIVTR